MSREALQAEMNRFEAGVQAAVNEWQAGRGLKVDSDNAIRIQFVDGRGANVLPPGATIPVKVDN